MVIPERVLANLLGSPIPCHLLIAQVATFGISTPTLDQRIRAMDTGSPMTRDVSAIELGDRIAEASPHFVCVLALKGVA